jgi:transcription elongation factor Elf1
MLNSIEKSNAPKFFVVFVRKHSKPISIVSRPNDDASLDVRCNCLPVELNEPFVSIVCLFFSFCLFVSSEDLSEAIDVYNAWIDACEDVNKTQSIIV